MRRGGKDMHDQRASDVQSDLGDVSELAFGANVQEAAGQQN